jgi:hypothetical protein
MSVQDLRAFFLSIPIAELANLIGNPVMLSHALNLKVWEDRIEGVIESENLEANKESLQVSLRMASAKMRLEGGKNLKEGVIERLLETILLQVCSGHLPEELIEHVLSFLTLIRAVDLSETGGNFFDDHFQGLPLCLRLSATSIKRLLLDHSDDAQLLKTWALLAKRAKDYYASDECRFFHVLFELCFASQLTKNTPEATLNCVRYLDLLNITLSSARDERTRRFLVYAI